MAHKLKDMTKVENDLFLEMLEVYINSILYLREVYPSAIFRKRRVYSTTAYISIYPPLNDYLLNTLKTAQELMSSNKLFQVELIISQKEMDLFGTPDDEEVLERYIFRVEQDENNGNNKKDIELYILRFEEELRRGLMQLDQANKRLKPLNTSTTKFRIHLETTERAYIDIVTKDNSKTKNFPWVIADEKYLGSNENSVSWNMLPVLQTDPFSLLLLATKKQYVD